MVIVEITKNYDLIEQITIKGHSNFAEHGYDIVCSAISSIIYSTLNSLKDVEKSQITLKDGFVNIDLKSKKLSAHDEVVIEVLLNGLNMIQNDYKKNLKIMIKEN